MDEFNYLATALRQFAQGIITITDYTALALKTVTVNGTVLTEATDFAKGASNDACATALAAAIDAIAGVNAAAVGPVITINADAIGTAGNAIGVATNATSGITLSAATLLGGVAATYTPAQQIAEKSNPIQMDSVVNITAITGGATLTITPQTSLDGDTWIDRTPTAALAAVAVTELHTTEPLTYWRYKLVMAGTSPLATVSIKARKSN